MMRKVFFLMSRSRQRNDSQSCTGDFRKRRSNSISSHRMTETPASKSGESSSSGGAYSLPTAGILNVFIVPIESWLHYLRRLGVQLASSSRRMPEVRLQSLHLE